MPVRFVNGMPLFNGLQPVIRSEPCCCVEDPDPDPYPNNDCCTGGDEIGAWHPAWPATLFIAITNATCANWNQSLTLNKATSSGSVLYLSDPSAQPARICSGAF